MPSPGECLTTFIEFHTLKANQYQIERLSYSFEFFRRWRSECSIQFNIIRMIRHEHVWCPYLFGAYFHFQQILFWANIKRVWENVNELVFSVLMRKDWETWKPPVKQSNKEAHHQNLYIASIHSRIVYNAHVGYWCFCCYFCLIQLLLLYLLSSEIPVARFDVLTQIKWNIAFDNCCFSVCYFGNILERIQHIYIQTFENVIDSNPANKHSALGFSSNAIYRRFSRT